MIRWVPRSCALIIGRFLGWLTDKLYFPRKKVCKINLDIAFGDKLTDREKKKIISKMYSNLGKNLMDFLRIPLITKENFSEFVTIKGEEHLLAAKKLGKGVLGITAHYGFWDIIPLYFAFKNFGANFITKAIRNPSLDKFWMEYRTYGGVNPIFKKNASRDIITILKNNESLGFVIDQNMNERSGVFVDFFSKKACTLDVVAKLSRNYGSPVLPMFCIRDENDLFTIEIGEPIPLEKGDTKEDIIIKSTRAYTRVLEERLKERPDHWIWLHKRWKTRPQGEEKIYK
ncbi:MAG: lysophospholipid acyltransferase family protein [Candidatus Aureabacteria bacterium]|nr:lysophospholipid acyltransferase family protein [Candidatus Auribacterota bacterium]